MSLDSPSPVPVRGHLLKIGIAAARYNERFVGALIEDVVRGLREAGVQEKNIPIVRVPGSNEVPFAAQLLADKGSLDAIVALGVIIRGGTLHYELIASASADALQRVSLFSGIPVINGIVVAENRAQAQARCLGKIHRGLEFAGAAVAMADLKRRFAR